MNENKHHRRSIRLKGYDYSAPGAYFITICAYEKQSFFGEIVDAGEKLSAVVRLSHTGRIVEEEWMNTEKIRNEIRIDDFVIMPNHIHGIVWITGQMVNQDGGEFYRGECYSPVRAIGDGFSSGERHGGQSITRSFVSPSKTIGAMVRGFKSATARRLRDVSGNPEMKVWHRNYWDHVIRDDADMARIREYVHNNPARWELDSLNCHCSKGANAIRPYGRR